MICALNLFFPRFLSAPPPRVPFAHTLVRLSRSPHATGLGVQGVDVRAPQLVPPPEGQLPVHHVRRELRNGAALLRRAARPRDKREKYTKERNDDFSFVRVKRLSDNGGDLGGMIRLIFFTERRVTSKQSSLRSTENVFFRVCSNILCSKPTRKTLFKALIQGLVSRVPTLSLY